MNPELKLCPFCGGEAKLIKTMNSEFYDVWYCKCQKCYVKTNEELNKNVVIEKWNRRK